MKLIKIPLSFDGGEKKIKELVGKRQRTKASDVEVKASFYVVYVVVKSNPSYLLSFLNKLGWMIHP